MNVTTPAHRDHDELLIVRVAEGDPDAVDARLAKDQLSACPDCRALFADVAAIRNATTAEVLRVPPRPRSFRIDPDILERQRMPTWRRWLSLLGSPSYDVLRPLAGAVAGIGLAVMVLGSVNLSAGFPSAASLRDTAASPAATQGATEVYAAPGSSQVPAPAATGDRSTAYGPGTGGSTGAAASPPSRASPASGSSATAAPEAPVIAPQKSVDSGAPTAQSPTSPGIPVGLVGVVLLVGGAGVFVLQTAGRRTAGR